MRADGRANEGVLRGPRGPKKGYKDQENMVKKCPNIRGGGGKLASWDQIPTLTVFGASHNGHHKWENDKDGWLRSRLGFIEQGHPWPWQPEEGSPG